MEAPVNNAPRPAYRDVLFLTLVCLLLVPALAGAALPGKQEKPFQRAPSLKERVKGNPKVGTGKSGGTFRLTYAPVQDPDYREVRDIFREERFLEEAVQGLNETFRIPRDVEVTLRECGEANAYYEADSRRISLCYELVYYYVEMFFTGVETEEEQEEAGEAVAGATLFTLLHELGHALIHLWDLPITGREEDAVDQLATIILLEGGEEGQTAALSGADAFWGAEEEGESADEEEPSFWDEHSLGEQRWYNIVCWSYGSDPEGLSDLVGDDWLPEARASQCPGEFARMSKAWDTLLTPYVKE
jgi:putative metallopeptidase DUF4344